MIEQMIHESFRYDKIGRNLIKQCAICVFFAKLALLYLVIKISKIS